jgi:hypothetical protein
MKRAMRMTRTAAWWGFHVFVVICAVCWALSFKYSVGICVSNLRADSSIGRVTMQFASRDWGVVFEDRQYFYLYLITGNELWDLGPAPGPMPHWLEVKTYRVRGSSGDVVVGVLYLRIYWILIVIPLSLVSGWMFAGWWLRRPRRGHCRTCRYDLTGNVSGVCPECGTAVLLERSSCEGDFGSLHERSSGRSTP